MFELNADLSFLIKRIKRYNKAEFDGYHDAAAEYFELLRYNVRDFREEGMRIRLQLDQIINNQTGEGAVLITKAWYRYGDGQAWQAFYVWRGVWG